MGFWVFFVHPTVVSVLLSAYVERCFVSRMRDFSFTLNNVIFRLRSLIASFVVFKVLDAQEQEGFKKWALPDSSVMGFTAMCCNAAVLYLGFFPQNLICYLQFASARMKKYGPY